MKRIKYIITKIMGDPNEKIIKSLLPTVNKINELENSLTSLSDIELKQKTTEFKQRIRDGETLDQILPEAFAVVREVSTRTLNMRHFDVQLMGGIILHQGRIIEMKTGEGKTLVSTLPAYLNVLNDNSVFLVTVNDYLAKRDSKWMGEIYEALDISVGLIQSGMPSDQRIKAYQCQIIYGTNNEFGFDYLRDNLAWDIKECCQLNQQFAIIDEVDSILIDEARTPLIISGPVADSTAKYRQIVRITRNLVKDKDFTLDDKHKNVILTDNGISKIEEKLGLSNIYSTKNMDVAHMAVQCLKGEHLFHRDVDYVVTNGEVQIVDEFTGRILEGRRYSDGLHQAIEASENLNIKEESQTLASITYQNYFRLFSKLAGMTGTAVTEEEEFIKIYGLDVVVVPTNEPVIRDDLPDLIYKSKTEKYKAIISEIITHNQKGQPILVGTISIDTSEKLSAMLRQKGIKHNVLNAKYHEKEADIITQAGKKNAVTIATNMAGRGTDIVLGDSVTDLGGLYVIGSERHESRRIDNQLRGRSGRQGDPGLSKFYVALDDDLMRLFGSDRIARVMEKLGIPADTPIEHGMISKSIERAQKKVEQYHFSIRKQILEYDDVMNKQRLTIYSLRRDILGKVNLDIKIKEAISEILLTLVSTFDITSKSADNQYKDFLITLKDIFSVELQLEASIKNNPIGTLTDRLYKHFIKRKSNHSNDIYEEVTKIIFLRSLDSKWMDHLHNMDVLREGIGLRAYGQRDPLMEYKIEAFDLFKSLLYSVYEDVLKNLNHVEIIEAERVLDPKEKTLLYNHQKTKVPSIHQHKIGRNDPCYCGSGKKYKKCCMK